VLLQVFERGIEDVVVESLLPASIANPDQLKVVRQGPKIAIG
jgi:hypothetical protein